MNFTQTVRILSKHEGEDVSLLLVPDGVMLPRLQKDQIVEMDGTLRYIDFDTWTIESQSKDVTYYAKFKASDVTLLEEEDGSLSITASWGHKEVTYRAS